MKNNQIYDKWGISEDKYNIRKASIWNKHDATHSWKQRLFRSRNPITLVFLRFHHLSDSDKQCGKAGEILVNSINSYTSHVRDMCAEYKDFTVKEEKIKMPYKITLS